MEGSQNEGDEIIIAALRQIECGTVEAADVKEIGQFTPEMIVEACSRALFLISDGDVKVNRVLPPNVASRHRICTTICNKVKEIGFPHTLGYNCILYPTEATTKQLLVWLVQKLPRIEEDAAEAALGANALLNRRITDALTEWVGSTWKMHFCSTGQGSSMRNIHAVRPFRTTGESDIRSIFRSASKMKSGGEASILETHAQELVEDAHYALQLQSDLAEGGGAAAEKARVDRNAGALRALIKDSFDNARTHYDGVDGGSAGGATTLSELLSTLHGGDDTANNGARGTRFQHATKFGHEKAGKVGAGSGMAGVGASSAEEDAEDTAARKARLEEEERSREQELDDLRASVECSQGHMKTTDRQKSDWSSRIRQLETELIGLHGTGEALEKDILIKRKTLEMLPNAAANIAKLQEICAGSAARLLQLAQEWETHRRPLIDQVRSITNKNADRRLRCKAMMEEMNGCKQEMSNMIEDLRDKQDRAKQLQEELAKLPQNLNRALYTHRILDIITNLNKMNTESEKIAGDIRDIQSTISHTSATLARSDAAAEERIFTAAQAKNCDKAVVETYRGLTMLRAKFDELMETVDDIGREEKAAQDLEVRIEQEMARVTRNNFDSIKADLKSVKQENKALVEQHKALAQS